MLNKAALKETVDQTINNAESQLMGMRFRDHFGHAVPWLGGGLALGALLGGARLLGKMPRVYGPPKKNKEEVDDNLPIPAPLLKSAFNYNSIAPAVTVLGAGGAGLLGVKLINDLVERNRSVQRKYMETKAKGELSKALEEQYQQSRPKEMLTAKAAAVLDEMAKKANPEASDWPLGLDKVLGWSLALGSPFMAYGAYNEYKRRKELAEKVPARAKLLKSIADAQRTPAPIQFNPVAK